MGSVLNEHLLNSDTIDAAERMVRLLIVVMAALALTAVPLAAEERLVDLSHAFNAETIYWPTEPGFKLDRGDAGITEQGYFYAANRFSAPEHGGTHIDAPYHFAERGEKIDQIPLKRLVGLAVCVDVSSQCKIDSDYQITIDDLKQWEQAQDETLAEKIVLLRTGFARHWPHREKYLGTSEVGRAAVQQLHFPGLHPAAASWLCSTRRIKAVGIDTASIDYGPSRDFAAHVHLFEYNTPALENVASMGNLPPKGFSVVALPMKIAGGTGAPCRVIAQLDD